MRTGAAVIAMVVTFAHTCTSVRFPAFVTCPFSTVRQNSKYSLLALRKCNPPTVVQDSSCVRSPSRCNLPGPYHAMFTQLARQSCLREFEKHNVEENPPPREGCKIALLSPTHHKHTCSSCGMLSLRLASLLWLSCTPH